MVSALEARMGTVQRIAGLTTVVALLICPSIGQATGFRIVDQSASATGQASAFTAQAEDASAVYYNPAGMTQLRRVQVSLGTLLIGGSTSFTSPTGVNARGDFGGSVAYPPPTNLYITANLKDLGVNFLGDLTAGLAVLSPFGTLQRYPNNGPFATSVTRAALELFDIKPTLAYKENDQLSLGLGLDIYTFFNFWGEGQAEIKFNSAGAPFNPLVPAGAPLEINGRDTALGFNASLMYTPLRNAEGKPRLNVGLIYRSQAVLDLKGQLLANGTVAADTRFPIVLPTVITGGIAYWPVRDQDREWKLEVDLDYTRWSSFRNTDVHLSLAPPFNVVAFPRNWKSTYSPMVGTEYKWLRPARLPHWEVAVRGGYWYGPNAVPDSTFSPSVPDSDNNALSIGLGLLCKEKGRFLGLFECGNQGGGKFRPMAIGLDLAYQALLYDTRTVNGSQPPLAAPGTNDGTYKTTYHIGSINLRVNF